MNEVTLKIDNESVAPVYQTSGSAAMDLFSNVETFTLVYGKTILVSTGVRIQKNEPKTYAFVLPRSGFATKNSVIIPNSPGLIDPDYRGDIKVGLFNLMQSPVVIEKGARIAQLFFGNLNSFDISYKDSSGLKLNISPVVNKTRGEGGFGSTN